MSHPTEGGWDPKCVSWPEFSAVGAFGGGWARNSSSWPSPVLSLSCSSRSPRPNCVAILKDGSLHAARSWRACTVRAPNSRGPRGSGRERSRVADQAVMIHPYFGYVNDPTRVKSANRRLLRTRNRSATRSPDVALVAVFGGSVADQFAKTWWRRAERGAGGRRAVPRPAHRGHQPVTGRLHSEPQQMLILAGLLAFGRSSTWSSISTASTRSTVRRTTCGTGSTPFYPYTWNPTRGRHSTAPRASTWRRPI